MSGIFSVIAAIIRGVCPNCTTLTISSHHTFNAINVAAMCHCAHSILGIDVGPSLQQRQR
jgi:hypothetical protein